MICPACGYENLQGDDECANCGADLRTADIPAPSNPIEEKLVAAPLSVLRPPRPVSVAPSTTAAEAVGLMRDSAIGCLLVEDRGRSSASSASATARSSSATATSSDAVLPTL